MTDKVIRDGKVAVLVSPGFGAGWSTWADDKEGALFSPEIVEWVENGKPDVSIEQQDEWESRYGYTGGLYQVGIEWVPQGTRFYIDEYDGSESLVTIGPDFGEVA